MRQGAYENTSFESLAYILSIALDPTTVAPPKQTSGDWVQLLERQATNEFSIAWQAESIRGVMIQLGLLQQNKLQLSMKDRGQ